MEAEPVKRGTVVPGVLAMVLVFLIVLSGIAFLVMQFNQYSESARRANLTVSERNKELLRVAIGKIQDSNIVAVNVTNMGSTASLIVGWVRVNQAGVPEFRRLSSPTPVQPLGTASLSIDPTPPSWKVGVWTSYGNVFWV